MKESVIYLTLTLILLVLVFYKFDAEHFQVADFLPTVINKKIFVKDSKIGVGNIISKHKLAAENSIYAKEICLKKDTPESCIDSKNIKGIRHYRNGIPDNNIKNFYNNHICINQTCITPEKINALRAMRLNTRNNKLQLADNELNDRRLKARIRGHHFGSTYGDCTGRYDDYSFRGTKYKGRRYLTHVWNHGWR